MFGQQHTLLELGTDWLALYLPNALPQGMRLNVGAAAHRLIHAEHQYEFVYAQA